MKESDLMHESGRFWVCRQVSKNAHIAPIGSVYYQIFENGIVASHSIDYVSTNLSRAIAACDRMNASTHHDGTI